MVMYMDKIPPSLGKQKKKRKLQCNFNILLNILLFIIITGYTSTYFTSAFNVNKYAFTTG